jgi:hypothetical protein
MIDAPPDGEQDYSLLDREPVLVVLGAAGTVVSVGLIAANALGIVSLDADQVAAVVAFVAVVSGVLVAALRGQVYAPATHLDLMSVAHAMPPPAPPLFIPPDTDSIDLE